MIKLKMGIVFATLLCSGINAHSQELDAASSLKEIQKCVEIQDDKDRLSCFDSAAVVLDKAVESGDVMIVDKVSVEEAKKEGFGLNLPSLSGLGKIFKSSGEPSIPNNADSITLKLIRIEPFGYKKNRFYFENGQIWDQIQPMTYRAPKKKEGVPYQAVITNATFGYNLRVNDKGKKLKVKRVK